ALGKHPLVVPGNGANPWHEEVKTRRLEESQVALWKKAAKAAFTVRSNAGRMYTSDDPAYVQRRVTKYRSQDLKSLDDPVQDGVGSSGVIAGVSQRGVSSWLAQGTFAG